MGGNGPLAAAPAGPEDVESGTYVDSDPRNAHEGRAAGFQAALQTACCPGNLHGPNRHQEPLPDASAQVVTIEEDEPEAGVIEGAVKQVEDTERRQHVPWILRYLHKMKGGLDTRLPIPSKQDLWWSWVGAFLSILAVSGLEMVTMPAAQFPLLVGSFGASAVLVFGVPESRLAQPRNFLGGQVLSAVVGVLVRLTTLPRHAPAVADALGMSLALLLMQLTSTTHPPGGATALIVCHMTTDPGWYGFMYVATVAAGSCIMMLVGLLVNNLATDRIWPTMWIG